MLYTDPDNTIRITRGDTARINVDLKNSSGETYELLESDILIFSVKRTIESDEYCIQKQIIGSNMFYFKPEDTNKLDFRKYKYDVQLVTENEEVYTVIEPSTFEVMPEVTTTWQ